MKIYTDLQKNPKLEKGETATIGELPGRALVDLGAHDFMCELLELMDEIEKDNKDFKNCWQLLRAMTGTALMRLEVKLRPQIEKAIAEGEALRST